MSRHSTSARQRWRMEIQNWLLGMVLESKGLNCAILDLGTEFGHTGRSVRAAFPMAKIVGVEVHLATFEACREDSRAVVPNTYTELHRADAMEFMEKTKGVYDAIVAAELIEHLSKSQGHRLLELLRQKSKTAIVTSPLGFQSQGPIYGNPYQEHITGWEPWEFEKNKFKTFLTMPGGYTLGVYYHDSTGRLK